MIDNAYQILDIAAEVLQPETIQLINRPSIHLRGWKILDRWALNSPEKLKALEAQGRILFLDRLLTQQKLEEDIMMLVSSLEAIRTGLTEHEILQMHEINTEL